MGSDAYEREAEKKRAAERRAAAEKPPGKLIFLGGTVGQNNWRESFIDGLHLVGYTDDEIFNPVVKDWDEEAQAAEDEAKEKADWFVYYLADPQQEGLNISGYSIWEAALALVDNPEKTVVVFDNEGLGEHAAKVQAKVEKDARKRFPDANIMSSPDDAINWFGSQ